MQKGDKTSVSSSGGMRCVAGNCSNRHIDGVSIHFFPKDAVRRKQWTDFVKVKRVWSGPTDFSVLCSDHFARDCFPFKYFFEKEHMGIVPKIVTLNKDAIPTIHKEPAPTIHTEKQAPCTVSSKQESNRPKLDMLSHREDSVLQKSPPKKIRRGYAKREARRLILTARERDKANRDSENINSTKDGKDKLLYSKTATQKISNGTLVCSNHSKPDDRKSLQCLKPDRVSSIFNLTSKPKHNYNKRSRKLLMDQRTPNPITSNVGQETLTFTKPTRLKQPLDQGESTSKSTSLAKTTSPPMATKLSSNIAFSTATISPTMALKLTSSIDPNSPPSSSPSTTVLTTRPKTSSATGTELSSSTEVSQISRLITIETTTISSKTATSSLSSSESSSPTPAILSTRTSKSPSLAVVSPLSSSTAYTKSASSIIRNLILKEEIKRLKQENKQLKKQIKRQRLEAKRFSIDNGAISPAVGNNDEK